MGSGFAFRNKRGRFQIDNEYSGYAALGKYSVNPLNVPGLEGWTYRQMWYRDVSCPVKPLVFIRIPTTSNDGYLGPGVAIYSVDHQGGNTWRIIVVATAGYTPSGNILHVFAPDAALGPSSVVQGLRVRDAAGDVVFDSGRQRLRAQNFNGANISFWIQQPHMVDSVGSPAAGDAYSSQWWDVPVDDASDLDVGNYMSGSQVRIDAAAERIDEGFVSPNSAVIWFPLWWRSGVRLKFGYRYVLAKDPGIMNKPNGLSYYGHMHAHRTPNKRFIMLAKPIQ